MFKRQILLLVIGALLLAACGQGAATPVATTAPAEPTAAAEATVAATEPAAEATEAPAVEATEAPAAEASGSCAADERLFDHELLGSEPLCIPAAPERVVALDMASVELLLISGQKPVATADWLLQEMPLLSPQYADELADVPGLGYPADLEAIAALQPDLILATTDAVDVELAGEIAPVVVPGADIYSSWKVGMEIWSAALNQTELYDEMVANYDTRIAELQAALGNPEEIEVSVLSSSYAGVSMWMPDTPPGGILSDVGLSRPASQSLVGDAATAEYDASQYIAISLERLDLADADAIFYFTYAATDAETAETERNNITALEGQPVWQSLNAVKAGEAFFVGGHWWRSQTYLLANLVLDDLFANLTDTTATTPVITGE